MFIQGLLGEGDTPLTDSHEPRLLKNSQRSVGLRKSREKLPDSNFNPGVEKYHRDVDIAGPTGAKYEKNMTESIEWDPYEDDDEEDEEEYEDYEKNEFLEELKEEDESVLSSNSDDEIGPIDIEKKVTKRKFSSELSNYDSEAEDDYGEDASDLEENKIVKVDYANLKPIRRADSDDDHTSKPKDHTKTPAIQATKQHNRKSAKADIKKLSRDMSPLKSKRTKNDIEIKMISEESQEYKLSQNTLEHEKLPKIDKTRKSVLIKKSQSSGPRRNSKFTMGFNRDSERSIDRDSNPSNSNRRISTIGDNYEGMLKINSRRQSFINMKSKGNPQQGNGSENSQITNSPGRVTRGLKRNSIMGMNHDGDQEFKIVDDDDKINTNSINNMSQRLVMRRQSEIKIRRNSMALQKPSGFGGIGGEN